MTNLDTRPHVRPGAERSGDRRVMLGLSVVFLAGFILMMATSTDRKPDADPATIIAGYHTSLATIRLESYMLMTLCAVVVFIGAGLRSRLANDQRRWTADVALAGFVLLAVTYAGFGVSALMLHHAIEIGDPTLVSAANLVDTTNFLPAMTAMICIYLGNGLTGLSNGTLPRWLAWTSVALGVAAPLGPVAFAPFVLLPVWLLVVVATARPVPSGQASRHDG